MEPHRYRKLKEIFLAACQRGHEERLAFLKEACSGDPALRADVESLLAHDEVATSFLREIPAWGIPLEPLKSRVGRPSSIGHYKILDVLGEGGMGVVYRAEQEMPRRTVALKVIKPGIASAGMLRRFEHEAEVLGRLQHPGIAHIFEAGTADTGLGPQPYFAMELVQGPGLIDWANTNQLSTRQRLETMAKICDAVHHAHQKGVIHRDLKPSNVLVDESGQPKILDFGVARATDSDVQTTSLQTDMGRLIGTIPYMSPEQVSGDPQEIDTRSDVYALGVMCYELLAGGFPYDVRHKTIPEAVRIISEEDPTPLSAVNRVFRGDIDTIATKALEKDKERRYQSASDLASDIRRYLRDEPIVARPASTLYQLRKFAARNRPLVAGLLAVLTILVVGIASTSWLALRLARANTATMTQKVNAESESKKARAAEQLAERRLIEMKRESDKTKAINDFFQGMLALADPEEARGREVAVREILERAAKKIDAEPPSEPEVEAALRHTIGQTYDGLGCFAAAEPHLRKALEIRRRALGEEDHDTLATKNVLAISLLDQHKLVEAETTLKELLETARRVYGDDARDTLRIMNNLACVLGDEGKLDEAEALLQETLDLEREVLGEDEPETLSTIFGLAKLQANQGKLAEAAELYDEASAGYDRAFAHDEPKYLLFKQSLLIFHRQQGKLAEAEALARELLSLENRVWGREHPYTTDTMNSLALTLCDLQKYEEGERLSREILSIRRKTLGQGEKRTLNSANTLALVLLAQGKRSEAEPLLRETYAGRLRLLGPSHMDTLVSMNNLASFLAEEGRLEEAEPLFKQAVQNAELTLPGEHSRLARFRNSYGLFLMKLRRYDEAEPLLLQSYAVFRASLGGDHPETQSAARDLIALYEAWGRRDEAERYREAAARPDGNE
ncbi:MAG: serine/threonine-protein kinase [Planctomycetota bacterium]